MDGPRRKSIVHRVEVPASSWALIIGKGGDNLKKMQDQYNVTIRVPRPNAPAHEVVTVRGGPDACAACEKAMQDLVTSMSRGKDRQKSQSALKPNAGSVGDHLPPKCGLCNSGTGGLSEALAHLCGACHVASMREHGLDSPLLPEGRLPLADLAQVLAEPAFREMHEGLGFDVGQLLIQIPQEEERRRAAEALNEQVSRLSPDFDWLNVDGRWFIRWDETRVGTSLQPMLKAPLLEEMLERCLPDAKPPVVRLCRLPAPLPRAPRPRKDMASKSRHMWPFEPTSRLSVAAALKLGLCLDDFDVMCGTSFIKALAGDASRAKDAYYLQRRGRALCCLHVPRRSHSQDDAGHAVEQLLCGSARNGYSFMAATSLRIGSARVFVTSEVDASDADGNVVELKSAKAGNGFASKENALQVAVNGSKYVLGCTLDSDRMQLEATEWIPAVELLLGHREAFIGQGQRARLLLDRVLNHEAFGTAVSQADAGSVMKLTFDNIRSPVIEPAEAGVEVLPRGL